MPNGDAGSRLRGVLGFEHRHEVLVRDAGAGAGRYRLLLTDTEHCAPVRLERGRLRLSRSAACSGVGTEAMVRWYRTRGLAWLPRRIAPWAGRMALHPAALDVRDLGYRWGSLGCGDRLNLHWPPCSCR